MNRISCLLVANRSEIALRIIRACRDLGIKTVLAVSEADRGSLPAKMADRIVCIGPPPATESYLKIGALVMAAIGSGAEAVHPGYGFLAEQPELPEACARYNLIFVGPKAEQIRQMGDKIFARQMAKDLGIPVIPGSELIQDLDQATRAAEELGYPVLLKAAAGGGGRGMKIARQAEDMKILFAEASAEAQAAFGDSRLYLERFIPRARHVEIQIMGDQYGQIVQMGERDCSLQRRYQKMLEEAPSPSLSPDLRAAMGKAALALAYRIRYENAGTIEFIFDQDERKFYFLEMNTRIQVEHPITEMITGVDLVKEQIRIASGEPLSFSQEDVKLRGHSIECRINAESPQQGFRPCPGRMDLWKAPRGDGIRVDSHCYAGYFVPPHYDSLLAKVIAWGRNRLEAIARMQRALEDFLVTGVETTIPFHRFLLKNPDFIQGAVHTRWIEDVLLKEFEQHGRDHLC
ncbi:MAG: acetyl-CoA carboxylase biotin carboxylase subunit [Planctomycetaceae bacterium]